MFYVHKISNPRDKWNLFEQGISEQARWVVANVETKTIMQNKLLETQEALSGHQILRASEYWVQLFNINCPDWQLVSESLIFALIEEWFQKKQIDSRYKDIEAFYNCLEQFLPLLSASQSDMLEDWLSQDPERKERLSGWLNHVKEFWLFLQQKKWISRPWSLAILLNKPQILFGEGKAYYFDLGADLKHQEVDFLKTLSRDCEVHLLMPSTEWTGKYTKALSVYNKALEMADEVKGGLDSKKGELKLCTNSFGSVVLEVQQATQLVRSWLNQGVPAHKIAVTCADIESYWDLIREYFLVEGIPVNKNYVGRAITLPYVQLWLSRLHINKKHFEPFNLEEAIFNPLSLQGETISYSEFRKNFFNVYDVDFVKKAFNLKSSVDEAYLLDTISFIDILYHHWSIEDKKLIDQVSDQIIADVRVDHKMSYELWVKYLELILSRLETLVHPADPSGVLINNTVNIEWYEISHLVVLGCTQGNLRESVKTPASIYDILAVERDLGFYLNRPEKDKNEFDLYWSLEKELETAYLFCSETNFEGAAQVASSLWLQFDSQNRDTVPIKGQTRWQSLMKSDWEAIVAEFAWRDDEQTTISEKLKADEDAQAPALKITQDFNKNLSATSLSTLAKCPFKFYADKVLDLEEPRYYDLDIDNLFQGNLLHKVIETIFIQHPNLEIKNQELESLYDFCLKRYPVKSQLKEFWLNERARHLKILNSFLEFEKNWRKSYPMTQTISMEGSIKGYLQRTPEGGVIFSTEPQGNSWLFKGKIDRVDKDPQNNLAILDYKLSSNNIQTFKNWPANDQFQLVLYALAIEKGLGDQIPATNVVAAAYLFLRETERGNGYVLSDVDHQLEDVKGKQKVTETKKEEVFSQVLTEVDRCLQVLENKKFPPIPKDKKICETCNWSRLCRAPHLR